MVELIDAFERAREDPSVGVVILTGEGPLAFCSGGDQRVRGSRGGYVTGADPAQAGHHEVAGRFHVTDLHVQIRRLPKPVVAMVAGYAIGGGHVLHVVCDLTIAADNARFGQTGPQGRLVRRRLRRERALAPGRSQEGQGDLVPVPPVRRPAGARDGPRQHRRAARPSSRPRRSDGAGRCSQLSPFSLRLLKASFNADEDGLAGIQQLAHDANLLFYMSEEAAEGRQAYLEKRPPDFAQVPAPRLMPTMPQAEPAGARRAALPDLDDGGAPEDAARPAIAPVLVGHRAGRRTCTSFIRCGSSRRCSARS